MISDNVPPDMFTDVLRVYIDVSVAPGGDGSVAKPFSSLGEAINSPLRPRVPWIALFRSGSQQRCSIVSNLV